MAIKPLSSARLLTYRPTEIEVSDAANDPLGYVGYRVGRLFPPLPLPLPSPVPSVYYFHDEILTGDRSSFDDSSSIFRTLPPHLRFFIRGDNLDDDGNGLAGF